jgi:hypothetical protein
MKKLTAILISIIFTSSLLAEEVKSLPDFSKSFPKEKLWSQTQLEGIETYSYATDLSFDELRKLFTKYLGDDWKELKIDEATKAEMDEMMAGDDTKFSGNIIFTNEAFPDAQVGLTQMEMSLMGKSYLVNVTVIKNTD